jgi:hypothetical protein
MTKKEVLSPWTRFRVSEILNQVQNDSSGYFALKLQRKVLINGNKSGPFLRNHRPTYGLLFPGHDSELFEVFSYHLEEVGRAAC